jgi:endonuclease/exonuclease/phosphatase family metal-dependent hydrolase
MELLTLNMQHGLHHDALIEFLQKQAETIDIFCLQEMTASSSNGIDTNGYRNNLLDSVSKALPGFTGRFDFYSDGLGHDAEEIDFDLKLGQALFHRDRLGPVVKAKAPLIITTSAFPTLAQVVDLKLAGEILRIVNYHGVPRPGDKQDTPERIMQSERILDLVADRSVRTIVVGDFNLMPDTRSVKMFEEAGFRNLVMEFEVRTTRSTLTKYHGTPEQQNYADYIFTKGVNVDAFEVLPDEVSDHLALKLKLA